MFILIGVLLAACVFAITFIVSAGRAGVVDLGSVSTQWLSEHREYPDGGRSR